MKKIYYLLILLVFSGFVANAQCGADSSNMQAGFYPPDTVLPVIIQGTSYDTFAQLYMPAFINDTTDTLQILTTIIDTITGLPTGINYIMTPASGTFGPNARRCFEFTGTTADTDGTYHLSFSGSVHVKYYESDTVPVDTILTLADFESLAVSSYGASPLSYAFVVQSPYVRPCDGLDTNLLTQPGAYPVPSDLPCIVQGVFYDQTVQGKIQTDTSFSLDGLVTVQLTVDSMELDSILGLPTGITFGRSPQFVHGGGYGCVNFAGTTTDTVGTYPLTAYGTVWFTGTADGQSAPYTYRGNLNNHSPFGGYYLRVVGVGDSCSLTIPPVNTGIPQYSASLNAAVSVFPNPNNGVFTLKIQSASAVNGQIIVYDAIGRAVYTQELNTTGVYTTTINLSRLASGIYTLQIRTPNGMTVKKISVE